jgi:hypothetical protein
MERMSDPQPADTAAALTEGGQRLAAAYAHTLGLVDQVTRAAEAGDYPYLSDVSGELSLAADELAAAASYVTTETSPTSPADLLASAEAQAHPES